jgi:hypothetical protein
MNTTQGSKFDDFVLWTGKPLFKPYLTIHTFSYQSTVRILLIGLAIGLFGSLWDNRRFDWNTFFVFIAILSAAGIVQILLRISVS